MSGTSVPPAAWAVSGRAHSPFTWAVDAASMSMAEPFMPHPEQPDTAFDKNADAPVPEEHGEPAEANETLTSAGRAAEDRADD